MNDFVAFLLTIFVVLSLLFIAGVAWGWHTSKPRRYYTRLLCYAYCCPCYMCSLFQKNKVWLPRKKSRPPKTLQKWIKRINSNFQCFNSCLSFMFHFSPIGCLFTKKLSVQEAITRYEEKRPMGFPKLYQKLKQNNFLDFILNLLNSQNSKFFFKILPTGSLRERYGKPLPSTSILGTDYDLMLIPDCIVVAETSQINARPVDNVAPLFEAVADPNQNPATPTGYVWLKLLNNTLTDWNKLCFDRVTPNGVEKFLSQTSVYNLMRGAIDGTIGNSLMFDIEYKVDDIKMIGKRNGPAFTITVEKTETVTSKIGNLCTTIKPSEEIFHCDFTFALYCPKFPENANDFFKRREDPDLRANIFWPNEEIVERIRTIGCHVVPKPSLKEPYSYTDEQALQSFLSQGVELEFRYSFSQAEIILSDNIPPAARTVFLAFKATIKKMVNYKHDRACKLHKIESYVLKTILFRQIESKQATYWNQENILEIFFLDMLNHLKSCINSGNCPMFWNRAINLLQDMTAQDRLFISDRLEFIGNNLVESIADDWLELERCVRLNCCGNCVLPDYQLNVIERDIERDNLIQVECGWCHYRNLYGNLHFDEDQIYSY